jgi:hypothetical protein
MAEIVLTRQMLRDLDRCERAFVLDMTQPDKNDETFAGVEPTDRNDVRLAIMENALALDEIRPAIVDSGGVSVVEIDSYDPMDRVRRTEALIARGDDTVIVNGSLENDGIVVPVSIMYTTTTSSGEKKWYVYHVTTKNVTGGKAQRFIDDMSTDAVPVVQVVSRVAGKFGAKVEKFAVIGLDGEFRTPYGGEYDEDHVPEAISVVELNYDDILQEANSYNWRSQYEAIMDDIRCHEELWVPDATYSPACGGAYPCQYSCFCRSILPDDSIYKVLPYTPLKGAGNNQERDLLRIAGLPTMSAIMEYLWEGGDLEHIPCSMAPSGEFSMTARSIEYVMAWSRRMRS